MLADGTGDVGLILPAQLDAFEAGLAHHQMGTGFVDDLDLRTEANLAFIVHSFFGFGVWVFWFFLGRVYRALGLRTGLVGASGISFIEVSASSTEVVAHFYLAMRTEVNIRHRFINLLKIEGLLTFAAVYDKIVPFALEASTHWTHWLFKQVVVVSTAAVGTLTVLEDYSAIGALVGLAEAEAFASERLSTSRTGHILSPQFAGRAANAISDIEFVEMELGRMASRTDSKGKLFGAAGALEEIVTLEDGLSVRTQRFSSAETGDQFVCVIACDARYIAAHLIEVLILVEELKAIAVGTAEVIHAVSAARAANFLPEVGFVKKDGAFWLLAVRTDLERPKLVSARVIANVGGECLTHTLRGFRCLPALRTLHLHYINMHTP